MAEGISREAMGRLMGVLANDKTPAADKLKESLAVIDKECQDLRIYVWAAKGRRLAPVYPSKELADFDMLEEIAEGLMFGENDTLDAGGRDTIYGAKIGGAAEGCGTIVLIEKRKKGMLPAGRFNPYHNAYSVMETIRKVCAILKPEEQFEELKERANVLDIPDKLRLLSEMEDGELPSAIGIVSIAAPDAVLDAGGYIFTSQLMRKWVESAQELSPDGTRFFYCSDTSFIVACSGSQAEGITFLKQLPDRLGQIRNVRAARNRIITLSADAAVVAIPLEEGLDCDAAMAVRKAQKSAEGSKGFMLFEKAVSAEQEQKVGESAVCEIAGASINNEEGGLDLFAQCDKKA